MADSTNNPDPSARTDRDRNETMSALFANLVVQQTNVAFMYLGRTPHPETNQIIQDLDSARFFIDQLEMLETKTRGNLDSREEGLLKQSLTGLRMAFVEAVNQSQTGKKPQAQPDASPTSSDQNPPPSPAEEESRKRFTKKY